MQYTLGTVQYVNGAAVFVASTDADWSDPKTILDGAKPVFIKVAGSLLPYQVATITPPSSNIGHTPPSRWEANITGLIGDATNNAAMYVLYWDFTEGPITLPIPAPDDVDVAAIMALSFVRIAAWAAGVGSGGGGGTGQTYQIATPSASSTVTSGQTSFRHEMRVSLGAGTGVYTVNVVLGLTGRVAGDVCDVHMDFPASVNPIVNIRNGTVGGGILWTWTGDGSVQTPFVRLVFDGTAWVAFVGVFTLFAPGGGGGAGTGQTYQPATISAAGNTASTQNSFRHRARLTVNAGAYIATFSLPVGRQVGDECRVSMNFAASTAATAQTLQIRNANATGTILWYWTSDGVARGLWATFIFDGTAWYLDSDGAIS